MSSLRQQLLPGLNNDITLTHIATKLPWRAFHVLSSVSRTWQQAIQDRMVYAERIRCHSTETLVVVKYFDAELPPNGRHWVSLYSMRERDFYKLPRIPQLERELSKYSEFVSLDGKLYVLGADSRDQYRVSSRGDLYFDNWAPEWNMKAYMLDLAGQMQWKMCASVPEPERGYANNIGHGFTVGSRHFVRGGSEDWFKSFWQECNADDSEWRAEERDWRVLAPQGTSNMAGPSKGPWFALQGKTYFMWMGAGRKTHEIDVYDFSTKSLTRQHSISWDEVRLAIEAALEPSPRSLKIYPSFIIPTSSELFVLAHWKKFNETRINNDSCIDYSDDFIGHDHGYCVLQTEGFGTGKKDIVWRKARPPSSVHFDENCSFTICPIQL